MTPEDFKLINYAVYATATGAITLWVGRSLHAAGRAFLRECFSGDATMADSVNHLLLVGFYLVNFGALSLFLKLERPPQTPAALVEMLSFKIGVALAGLGAMHLFNMYNFDNLRRRALLKKIRSTPPKLPVTPLPAPIPAVTPEL